MGSYNRRNHYSQSNSYYSHYTRPQTYYYSSSRYSSYGKRSIPDYSEEELSRMIREVSHKKDQGKRLSDVEEQILEIFGEGLSVDTSKTTAVFDFAAQAGKYWKRGG